MKLSIIIVNYNVEYFLEQCLHSVRKACKNISSDVYVVDNNSVDGSVEMVAEKFPEVILIANKDNPGFSKANNQAIKISKAEYVLLLNPDTVVEEDTFEKVIDFMDSHPDAGGLGVKMIDGKGNFLPESKRGLPTPSVAFYKIFGLSKLFPKSKKFAKYHLGHLDNDKIHEIDVLAGAFMLMRKETLDKVGLLDETFFMYGEDIDLSYRIILGGYKNYYYPDTSIIHYKGESTKKGSLNYVFVFYNAMIIFAKKHFSQKHASIFSLLINMAIYLRAGASILSRFIKKLALPLADAAIMYSGMLYLTRYWERNHKFIEGGEYPFEYIAYVLPAYIIIWQLVIKLSGGYDKPVKPARILRGIAIGTFVILAIYGLLSESWRYSRALIIMGAAWTGFSYLLSRFVLHLIKFPGFDFDSNKQKRILIVGDEQEADRVQRLLQQTHINSGFVGLISPDEHKLKHENQLGILRQLQDIINIYKADEVIFCAKNLSAQEIINQMSLIGNTHLDIKIAPPESMYVIGSNSINAQGELYALNVNSITKKENQRNKRILDVLIAVFILLLSPILILFVKNKLGLVGNLFQVMFGKKSWVGYSPNGNLEHLPKIKDGVLNPSDTIKNIQKDKNTVEKLNLLYAKEYQSTSDLNIITHSIRDLGRAKNEE